MAAKSKSTLVSAAQAVLAQALEQNTQKSTEKSAPEERSSAKSAKEKKASAAQASTKAAPAKSASAKAASAKSSLTKTASTKAASAKSASAKKSTKKEATKATAAQKEQARKARAGARLAGESAKATRQAETVQPATPPQAALATANASELASTGEGPGDGGQFLAAHYTTGDIWVPNVAIPAIDEATYQAQKTQAEGQRRAIEVASLNLQNIKGLHQLEHQNVEVAISAKTTETRAAQLTGAEIDYQRQVEQNSENSQYLMQDTAKREAATRETGYTQQLIALKDQNFELEIQQAQTVFAEKAARYRAQLTGQ